VKVISTGNAVLPANKDVIERLKSVLDLAEKGLISDLAIAYVGTNGDNGSRYCHGQNRAQPLIGSLFILQLEIAKHVNSNE
jgi:hypothetical protein